MRIFLLAAAVAIALTAGTGKAVDSIEEQAATQSTVVINEIHCNPDVETELVEFLELYNSGTAGVNLSGWFFSKGLTYTFPNGTVLAAKGYIIVAQNPTAIRAKWGSGASAVPVNLIFGPYAGKLSSDGEKIQLCDSLGVIMDEVDYQLGFPWPTVGDTISGVGYSMQLMNPALDNDLGGSWRSAAPTPAKVNSAVYTNNAPPIIRQVSHTPQQPKSGEAVTVTAKVTDSDGVLTVRLLYQIVEPGSYVPVTLPNYPSTTSPTTANVNYKTNWTTVVMHDDGLNGDAAAGDGTYSVLLPASVQKHRRLIRYTLTAGDDQGVSIDVPYADDPQPNFAYFVYDGVPAWKGAIQPGGTDAAKKAVVTYSAELMSSLPVYHLLSRATDVQNCQYNSSYDNRQYYFSGTLIYDGAVYDNVHYRIRGQYSTFQTGKNKWKFEFNRGHYFQARDNYGEKYQGRWHKMNVGTGVCPWWQYPHPSSNWDQGTQGMVMNEVLGFHLYNMTGVPSCTTNYFHFRVIDSATEADAANQYEGDFWGLYFTIEQADGAFLDEHDLPDGNVYRMDSGYNQTHQGAGEVSTGADVATFINTYNARPGSAWWAQNVNLANYYNSKAVGVAINDSDRRPEYNCVYYHNSETGQWWMLPWDLDLTFEWGNHYTDWEHFRYALDYPEYGMAYKNRARELLDLLFNGEQASQVVEEIAAVIATPYGGNSFVEANRAMWDYNPKTSKKGQFYANNEFLKSKDWPGLVEYYEAFLTPSGPSGTSAATSYGVKSLVAEAADTAIPDTPVVAYIGSAGHPLNNLKFQTSNYHSPVASSTFAAMKWRLARVETGSQYVVSTTPQVTTTTATLLASQASGWRYFKGLSEPSSPVDAWRQASFNDSSWLQGQTSIGFGDSDDKTTLTDMQNKYTSIYLRNRFTVSNAANVQELKLRVYVDDGCIIWINGTEVARFYMADGFIPYNGVATPDIVGDAAWEEISLPTPYGYLVNGQNVIAIHALNNTASSSDLSIDVALTADVVVAGTSSGGPTSGGTTSGGTTTTSATTTLPAYPAVKGRYEIDAVWESAEITSFNNTVTIPASSVESGATYRVRCRMKDKTGRWSHWSAPVEFVAGT
jgi:hypothetical protein